MTFRDSTDEKRYFAYIVHPDGTTTQAKNPDGHPISFRTLGEGCDFITTMRAECARRGNTCPMLAVIER